MPNLCGAQQSKHLNTKITEKAKATEVTEKITGSPEAANSTGTSACICVHLRQNFFLLLVA